MQDSPQCPQCQSTYSYPDGNLWICPECFHEWSLEAESEEAEQVSHFIDAHGSPLESGDTVTTVKELKMGKETLKSGTKVKNIRLLDNPVDGHDISCKIPGHGSVYLKCSVVKKIN